MNKTRIEGLMPLYGSREKGRQGTVREVGQLRERNLRRQNQERPRNELERIRMEEPFVQESFRSGSLLPFLELRQEEALEKKQESQERWQEQINLLKERYTHARLQADLKKAFNQEKALIHARQIHDAIMAHPETLKLLQKVVTIRHEQNRVIIGSNVLKWMLWAAGHRQQLHDAINKSRKAKPAARFNPTQAKTRWTARRSDKARVQTASRFASEKRQSQRQAA